MSGFSELAERVGTIGDTEATANAIAADLKLSVRAREILWPVILSACENIDRGRVRYLEQKVGRVGRVADPTGERASLMRETFSLPDGRRVEWGTATVEDHQSRADFLAKQRDGITSTIARHVEAIEAIRTAGVRCLDELARGAA